MVQTSLLVVLWACPAAETCETIWQKAQDGAASGTPSGLEWCWSESPTNGVVRRVTSATQTVDLHSFESCTQTEGECATNAQCGTGACTNDGLGFVWCTCIDVCRNDAECGPGAICTPTIVRTDADDNHVSALGARCVPATCATGADCASGACRMVAGSSCGVLTQALCETDSDRCHDANDCESDAYCGRDVQTGAMACLPSSTCE